MTSHTTHTSQQTDSLVEAVATLVVCGVILVRKLVVLAIIGAVCFGAFNVATRSSHGQPSLLAAATQEASSFISGAERNLRQSPPSRVGDKVRAPFANALVGQSQQLVDQVNQAGR